MKRDVEESREIRWDTSVSMSDDDEPLIPRMPNRGKSPVKPEKNLIFLKKGKTLDCRYSTGGKYRKFLDLE